MIIKLNEEIYENILNGNLKAKDLIKYVLENSTLHFKIKDIKGELTKENVYNQLSLERLYNDNEKRVRKAYLKNNDLVLEF